MPRVSLRFLGDCVNTFKCGMRNDHPFEYVQKFLSPIFESNLFVVCDGVMFWRVLVVAAHFAIFKNSNVVLVSASSAPKARNFTTVFPCDEVVAVPVFYEMEDEVFYRYPLGNFPEQVVLAPGVVEYFEL